MARLMNSFSTVLAQTRKGTIEPEDFVRYLGVYRAIAQSAGGQHWLNDIGLALITEEAAKVLEAADPIPLISRT